MLIFYVNLTFEDQCLRALKQAAKESFETTCVIMTPSKELLKNT